MKNLTDFRKMAETDVDPRLTLREYTIYFQLMFLTDLTTVMENNL